MNQMERIIIIIIGGVMAGMVTGTVCYAAIQSLASSEGGLQNLLFGGLIGTGAFGGGVLFTVLNLRQAGTGTGSGSSVTVPQEPPSPPITVRTTGTDET